MKKFIWVSSIILFSSCVQPKTDVAIESGATSNWKSQFEKELPLLGHRNWIIVADKAFPEQNAAGIEYINTNENLMPVLQYVLEKVNGSGHVKPIIYRDKELGFITEAQVKGIGDFRAGSEKILKSQNSNPGTESFQTILHDSVFTKLDAASKLFKVVVLKTNETLPYTSVFLQLDCAYWNGSQEKELREAMSK